MSSNELTGGQKAGARESTEAQVASDMASAMLSAQLSRMANESLNLDMLEIRTAQSTQQGSFRIGKYLTNDLFVSYEKTFGDPQSNETAPEIVTLEYQVTRFLFLELILLFE